MSILDLYLPWKQLNLQSRFSALVIYYNSNLSLKKRFSPTIKTLEIKFDTFESEINSISNKIVSLEQYTSKYRRKLQGDYDRIKLFPAQSDSAAALSGALLQANAFVPHKAQLMEDAIPSLTCQVECC